MIKSDKLPTLTPPELRLVSLIACQAINRRPFQGQDGLLSPMHFVLTSPMYHLLELGPGPDGRIDFKNSYQKLGRYLNIFKETRRSMLKAESQNFMKKRFYGNKNKDLHGVQEGDLVFVDYEQKLGTFDYGIVKSIEGSNATCIFRYYNEKVIPVSILYSLSPKKFSMADE